MGRCGTYERRNYVQRICEGDYDGRLTRLMWPDNGKGAMLLFREWR